MIIFIRRLVAAFALLIFAAPVLASDIQFHKSDDGDGGYISLIGDIKQGDADKFRALAAGTKADTVFLSSQGGSLSEAFEIGRIITVSNYTTVVIDDAWCSSACALIWIAGAKRYAQPRAHIGFHAGYTVDNGKPITSGMANALIGRYLTQLNLPADAIVFATSATPDNMAWLDTARPGSQGISFLILPSSDSSQATSPPPPITPIAKSTSATPSLAERSFGKWKVHIEPGFYGVGTPGVDGTGLFAYFCPAEKICRYAAQINLTCVPGNQYSMKYRVDGYDDKPIELTCDTDGKTLYFNSGSSFGRDIKGEIGVTFLTETDKGAQRSIRFNLVGLDEAVAALTKAGYITDLKK